MVLPFKWNLFEQYIQKVLSILCVVLTFKAVDEILLCVHSIGISSTVLSHGNIFFIWQKKKFEFFVDSSGSEKTQAVSTASFLFLNEEKTVGGSKCVEPLRWPKLSICVLINPQTS